ncbi:ABC transporter permease [Massilia horti]|uniref:ABC transporter permease n=1 Tax=Massilia horti TaxID=2562153 RepID=UPI001431DABC|nr:hypothetical protein [Massilia horti]
MNKLKNILPALTLIALVVAAWWIVVLHTESVIFPTPAQVATGAFELAANGTLWEHISASLLRVAIGFSLAVALAVPLGLWMGRVDAVYRALSPLFQIMRPISPIAWIALTILWSGVGNASPVFLIFLASVFPMIVQTAAGMHAIERRYLADRVYVLSPRPATIQAIFEIDAPHPRRLSSPGMQQMKDAILAELGL